MTSMMPATHGNIYPSASNNGGEDFTFKECVIEVAGT